MYKIYFYKDRKGNQPVADYFNLLAAQNNKDRRIKATKIRDYIKALSLYGTQIGEPYLKHLEGEIWELRPLRDRILFAAWIDNSFVLLHTFMKKLKRNYLKSSKGGLNNEKRFAQKQSCHWYELGRI